MKSRNYAPLLFASLIAGCAAYDLPPLATTHPAHAEAMVSRESPVSRTLAYTPADLPLQQPAMAKADEQESRAGAPAAAAAPQTVEGEGKVVATVPSSGQIVVEHGEIKGFMDAMTMGYRTEPSSLFQNVDPMRRRRTTFVTGRTALAPPETMRTSPGCAPGSREPT